MNGVWKSITLSLLVVALAAATPVWAQDEAAGGLRFSITVSQFENQSGWHGQWDLGNAWGTVLTDMLNQSGRFIVLGETECYSFEPRIGPNWNEEDKGDLGRDDLRQGRQADGRRPDRNPSRERSERR